MQNYFAQKILLFLLIILMSLFVQADTKQSLLAKYKVIGDGMQKISLTSSLTEISGIAFTEDGRLFAHNDEVAIMYEVDKQTGKIVKWFNVGEYVLTDDFEDIAIFGPNFYIVTSKGDLFRFYEQPDKGYSQYRKFSTGLTRKHDVEGLCYDPVTHSLLLACKGSDEKKSGYKNVYTFDLNSKTLLQEPRFRLNISEVTKLTGIKDFSPSGIERNSVSGSFFIISANDKAIIEISAEGKLLAQSKLKNEIHKQPEGITFGKDLFMYISDEGGKSSATLTKYPFTRK